MNEINEASRKFLESIGNSLNEISEESKQLLENIGNSLRLSTAHIQAIEDFLNSEMAQELREK